MLLLDDSMATPIHAPRGLGWPVAGEPGDANIASWAAARRSRFSELPAGEQLDRQIERRVFGRDSEKSVPPFSTEDWTATALAELASRRTGWWFDVAERDGVWEAMWIEHPPISEERKPGDRILSLITATASTRALAICRSLLRAAACPRWPAASGLREP